MSIHQFDTIIVGAGLSGLFLGLKLQAQSQKVKTIEKSKGCGGRLATRRSGELKFDHGAPFINASDLIRAELVSLWTRGQALKELNLPDGREVYAGQMGMTQLAKLMAHGQSIDYGVRASHLKRGGDVWQVTCDSGDVYTAKKIVLTCPLPQALELLKVSQISYQADLDNIKFNKALVMLFETDSALDPDPLYVENVDADIFSLSSQSKKGISQGFGYTLVFTPAWSERHFELAEEEILELALMAVKRVSKKATLKSHQLKKWRYSTPISSYTEPFAVVAQDLYLIGDAFGQPNGSGAIESAQMLFTSLFGINSENK